MDLPSIHNSKDANEIPVSKLGLTRHVTVILVAGTSLTAPSQLPLQCFLGRIDLKSENLIMKTHGPRCEFYHEEWIHLRRKNEQIM